jgi:hypothetical protein
MKAQGRSYDRKGQEWKIYTIKEHDNMIVHNLKKIQYMYTYKSRCVHIYRPVKILRAVW